MSTTPLKRRKLDHGNHETTPKNGVIDNNLIDTEDSKGESPVSQSRPTQSKTKHTQDGDESAIYSGGVYKSSIFKLQVDEMLSEVRPNYQTRLGGVDDALRKLKGLIEGIEGREPLTVSMRMDTITRQMLTIVCRSLMQQNSCRSRTRSLRRTLTPSQRRLLRTS